MTESETPPDRPELDDVPPLLGSWGNIYLVVLGSLGGMMLFCWWVTATWA